MKRFLLLLLVAPLLLAAHYAQSDAVFQVKCGFVRSRAVDPIVYPGQSAPVGHQHDFFNVPVTGYTTTEKLLALPGNCTFGARASQGPEPDDHAAYWAPSVSYNGTYIDTSQVAIDAYYWLGEHHPPVQPFPLGLKIIAGDSHATEPQPLSHIRWRCVSNNGDQGPNSPSIPDCRNEPLLDTVAAVVLFPECWDGVNLDSPDHKSHMAYATKDGCPETHPVKVPKLTVIFRYLGAWKGGPGSELSSGGVYSMHADFWNAWVPERHQALVDSCLNAVVNCRYV